MNPARSEERGHRTGNSEMPPSRKSKNQMQKLCGHTVLLLGLYRLSQTERAEARCLSSSSLAAACSLSVLFVALLTRMAAWHASMALNAASTPVACSQRKHALASRVEPIVRLADPVHAVALLLAAQPAALPRLLAD